MSDDSYYEVSRWKCHECGHEWETPGAAETCHYKHELQDVMQRAYNHDSLLISDVIDAIEEMVLAGEFDDERLLETEERLQERRDKAMAGDAPQLRAYIRKLEGLISDEWESQEVRERFHNEVEWRSKQWEDWDYE